MSDNCNECFPKTARLRKSTEFKKVFDARRKAADDVLIVFGCENGLEHSRLGLSVSRKVGNAVVRNRWKRLIREAFRKSRSAFSLPLDLVVLPQKGAFPPTAQRVEESLRRLVKRLIAKLLNR
jgi:ribonuclease P protein component